MPSEKMSDKVDLRALRRRLKMNQTEFWSKIGVTQSGGSRYESGRNMPKPVQLLVELVHIEGIDIKGLKREEMQVLEYLKANEANQWKELKKRAKEQTKAKK